MSARPAAKMFFAAFTSRSWTVPHARARPLADVERLGAVLDPAGRAHLAGGLEPADPAERPGRSARLLLDQPQELRPAGVVDGPGQPGTGQPGHGACPRRRPLGCRGPAAAPSCARGRAGLPAPCGARPRPGAGPWPGWRSLSACGTAPAAPGPAGVPSPAGTADCAITSPSEVTARLAQADIDAHLTITGGERRGLAFHHERGVVPAVRLPDHRDRRRLRTAAPGTTRP